MVFCALKALPEVVEISKSVASERVRLVVRFMPETVKLCSDDGPLPTI